MLNLLLGLGGQELMLRLVRRLLRGVALLLCAGFGNGVLWPALVLRLSVLARYYVDEEVPMISMSTPSRSRTLKRSSMTSLGRAIDSLTPSV